MNPKQRRGAITLLLAIVGAVVVFLGVVSYVGSVSAEVGPKTKVFVAKEDIPKNKTIDLKNDVELKDLPNKYVTEQMATNLDQLAGQKAANGISKGSFIQIDSLVPISNLQDGEREITINLNADQGINGRVAPGDVVDVVAAFAKERENDNSAGDYRRADIPYNVAGTLVPNARVVSVGQAQEEALPAQSNPGDPAVEGVARTVAVTFAVSAKDASRLAYGESFAVSMRIVRTGNNETGTKIKDGDRSFEDPDLPSVLGSTGSK